MRGGSGEPTWRPSAAQAGRQRFVLVARADGQEAVERIEVAVECERPHAMAVGCGCGGPSFGALALAGLVALVARRRARP